jgi:hypothetical protein
LPVCGWRWRAIAGLAGVSSPHRQEVRVGDLVEALVTMAWGIGAAMLVMAAVRRWREAGRHWNLRRAFVDTAVPTARIEDGRGFPAPRRGWVPGPAIWPAMARAVVMSVAALVLLLAPAWLILLVASLMDRGMPRP